MSSTRMPESGDEAADGFVNCVALLRGDGTKAGIHERTGLENLSDVVCPDGFIHCEPHRERRVSGTFESAHGIGHLGNHV